MKKEYCGSCGKVINGFIYGPWYDKQCGKCRRKCEREQERIQKQVLKERERLEKENGIKHHFMKK